MENQEPESNSHQLTPGMASIVIPVYNVESYIRECFESVLAQEHQNFEVLMVDDGSTDNSGAVCDEYAARDSRFHVWHTENLGIGHARNLAMDHMRGQYCFFLDPDDVIETDTLSYMVDLIERTKSDLALAVTCQFAGQYTVADHSAPTEVVYDSRTEIIENVFFDKNDMKPLSRKAEVGKVVYEFFSCLYRVENLNRNGIRFLPISYGEDTYVCLKSQLTSQRVVTSTKIVYSHRRNPTSTTFQYHPFYLDETKEYYRYYMGLFEEFAQEYATRGAIALDGQYFRRAFSGIERELIMSPMDKPAAEKAAVIKAIREDEKLSGMLTRESMKYAGSGKMHMMFMLVKWRMYGLAVWLCDTFVKRA